MVAFLSYSLSAFLKMICYGRSGWGGGGEGVRGLRHFCQIVNFALNKCINELVYIVLY